MMLESQFVKLNNKTPSELVDNPGSSIDSESVGE